MNSYKDFIQQTFEFPTDEFKTEGDQLHFHGIDLKRLIEKHGTPLKVSFLPIISKKINFIKDLFESTLSRFGHDNKYTYCYCTKSSHFKHIIDEVLQNDVHLETSSAFDIAIVKELFKSGKINKATHVICNGFKRDLYTQYVSDLLNDGFENCVPILDNKNELDRYLRLVEKRFQVGMRVASDEEPNFSFYTSRLGIKYGDIIEFYRQEIEPNEKIDLSILHFFVNQGISDRPFYWNELDKFVTKYCELKKICPSLRSIDIGGGFPIKTYLDFDYDYAYIVEEIITNIIRICNQHNVEVPHIFTEFGSYTVGESGMTLYSILDEKLQNDKEYWYMIDGSFITNLPDTWALNQRFILLAVNKWNEPYKKVNLGGLTCDSMDYYNFDRHQADVFLPQTKKTDEEPLYIGLFHTGAYQESIGGFGGIQHCLIPSPKHLILDYDQNGTLIESQFCPEQSEEKVLNLLGYTT